MAPRQLGGVIFNQRRGVTVATPPRRSPARPEAVTTLPTRFQIIAEDSGHPPGPEPSQSGEKIAVNATVRPFEVCPSSMGVGVSHIII